MRRIWLLLVPELERFAQPERSLALERARKAEWDTFELVGLAVAVAAVAALTQYTLDGTATGARAAALLVNFVVAVPLLAVLVAPLALRRVRRGVHAQLQPGPAHE